MSIEGTVKVESSMMMVGRSLTSVSFPCLILVHFYFPSLPYWSCKNIDPLVSHVMEAVPNLCGSGKISCVSPLHLWRLILLLIPPVAPVFEVFLFLAWNPFRQRANTSKNMGPELEPEFDGTLIWNICIG